MPSTIRFSSSVSKPTLSAFQKKQKMSLTQTYYLAHTARGKLSKEAAKADHDLRLLVGHANLLDGLMVDLADAEREQESWFNQTVSKAASSTASSEAANKRVQWADSMPSVAEDYDEEDSESDSESDSEDEWDTNETVYATAAPLRRIPSPPASTTTTVSESAIEEDDEDEEEEDEDEDDEELQLVRTPSRSSPPELLHESDSEESEDDSMPPSPPSREIPLDAFSAKQRQIANKVAESMPVATAQEDSFYQEGFFLPQRQSISAY